MISWSKGLPLPPTIVLRYPNYDTTCAGGRLRNLMPHTTRQVDQCLCSKLGFSRDDSRDHVWYTLCLPNLPVIRTKVSHGSKALSNFVEGCIARQIHVRRPFYNALVDCTKSRADYEQELSTNPAPPFPTR